MLFTTEDRVLVKHYRLRLDKKYGRKKIGMNFRINLGQQVD